MNDVKSFARLEAKDGTGGDAHAVCGWRSA